jgi:hypothetical protein
MPALVAQGISVFEIPGLIAFDLRFPEITAGFWGAGSVGNSHVRARSSRGGRGFD